MPDFDALQAKYSDPAPACDGDAGDAKPAAQKEMQSDQLIQQEQSEQQQSSTQEQSVQGIKPEQPAQPEQSAQSAQPEQPAQSSKTKKLAEQILEALYRQEKAISALEKRMQTLAETVSPLQSTVEKQIKSNVDILRDSKNYQANVQNGLQQELEKYRKMHAETAQAPLLTELANLLINARRVREYLDTDKERTLMEDQVTSVLEDILTDQGVVIRESKTGDLRNQKQCKIRKTIPVGDKAKEGTVAKSYNPAFTLGNLVLVKENIDCFVYSPELDPDLQSTLLSEDTSTENVEASVQESQTVSANVETIETLDYTTPAESETEVPAEERASTDDPGENDECETTDANLL